MSDEAFLNSIHLNGWSALSSVQACSLIYSATWQDGSPCKTFCILCKSTQWRKLWIELKPLIQGRMNKNILTWCLYDLALNTNLKKQGWTVNATSAKNYMVDVWGLTLAQSQSRFTCMALFPVFCRITQTLHNSNGNVLSLVWEAVGFFHNHMKKRGSLVEPQKGKSG